MKKINRNEFMSSSIGVIAGTAFSTSAIAEIIHEMKPLATITKNVGILIFDNVEVLDFAGPFEVFSVTESNNSQPFRVFTLSQDGKSITAVNGLKVTPDYSLENHTKIDILIIPGGIGTRKLLDNPNLLEWVKKTHATTQLTMSICTGAIVLGKLGMLDGKPYSTHHDVYEYTAEIAPTGIPQKDKRFVQSDERLYTSGGISAGIDLSFHIVSKLLGKEIAKSTAEYMEYNYQS
jgi:transcriptional regulator GlxA family with amidase domain